MGAGHKKMKTNKQETKSGGLYLFCHGFTIVIAKMTRAINISVQKSCAVSFRSCSVNPFKKPPYIFWDFCHTWLSNAVKMFYIYKCQ